MPKLKRSEKGFTIAELTIASAIFSVVILTAVGGFLQMGRIFYKGVTLTSTQETANQIYQDIGGYFQTAATVSPILHTQPSPPAYNYFCVGGARYTFTNKEVNASTTPNHSATTAGNFGILKDILPDSSACDAPCDDNPATPCTSGTRFNSPQELLGDKMRLLKFDIQPSPTVADFYTISMILAYGDNEDLAYTNPSDASTGYCQTGGGTQYCSVVKVDASLSRGYK